MKNTTSLQNKHGQPEGHSWYSKQQNFMRQNSVFADKEVNCIFVCGLAINI